MYIDKIEKKGNGNKLVCKTRDCGRTSERKTSGVAANQEVSKKRRGVTNLHQSRSLPSSLSVINRRLYSPMRQKYSNSNKKSSPKYLHSFIHSFILNKTNTEKKLQLCRLNYLFFFYKMFSIKKTEINKLKLIKKEGGN